MQIKLGPLVSGDGLKAISAAKSKKVDEMVVRGGNLQALDLRLAAEQMSGWRLHKRGRKSLRLVRDKPVDRQLEDDVWSLLYRMGFKELNADRRCMLDAGDGSQPRQLDVFAKDDATVLVVECTHAREVGAKSVKSLLDKLVAVRDDVIKAVHVHYGEDSKLKIKFAIATRNVEWRKADRERSKATGIAMITEADLDYFNKLTNILKVAARYQFLGRYFRGETVEGLRAQVPATRGKVNDHPFYSFLISPHELLRLSYISHRSRSSNDGVETYQRMVKPSRLAGIGRYIDKGGRFPTNIVVNINTPEAMVFEEREAFGDTATGILHLPARYGCAWVIDGQHRLYGYGHAKRGDERDQSVVPVLAYENLTTRQEIDMFVDINSKQVKVSRNLVNEILSTLDIDDEDPAKRLDAMQARIGLMLDARSPMRDRVLTVSEDRTHVRCLTLTSLADGIAENNLLGTVHRAGRSARSYLEAGPLADVSGDPDRTMDKAVDILALYFGLFADRLVAHWALGDAKGGYLCTNNGIRSLLILLRNLVGFAEANLHVRAVTLEPDAIIGMVGPYVEPVIAFFERASANDIASFRGQGSSIQSVNTNALHMMAMIKEALPSFRTRDLIEFLDGRDVQGTRQAADMVAEMDRILFDDVVTTLRAHYGAEKDAWWLQGVPKAVRNGCDQRYNTSAGERERWRYLLPVNLPDTIVFAGNWELFRERYDFHGTGKKADLVRWMGRLSKARTITQNAGMGPLTKDEVEYVRVVHALVTLHILGGELLTPGQCYLQEVVGDGLAAAE